MTHIERAEMATNILANLRRARRMHEDRLAKAASGQSAAAARRKLAKLSTAIDNIDFYRAAAIRTALVRGELGDAQDLAKMGISVDLEKMAREDAATAIAKVHRARPTGSRR